MAPSLALAREAFGNEPDAVNLWIGDDRSVSAVHKDHYEVRQDGKFEEKGVACEGETEFLLEGVGGGRRSLDYRAFVTRS